MQAADHQAPKRRGRPKGTGLDDEMHLQAISDRVLADPQKPPRAVIRDIVHETILSTPHGARNAQPESIVHRLAEKWRNESERHLAAARARRSARQLEVALQGAVAIQRGVENFALRAAPFLQATANSIESALRKPEVQKALAWMAKFEATQHDPCIAKIEALKRDPRMAKWMMGPLQGGHVA
jgi:hypothetical protein